MGRQFLAFLVVSATAALANVGARVLFSHWVGFVPAIAFAFCVGLSTAFVLNRLFVFKAPSHGLRHQMLWFLVVNLAALGQTLVVSLVLARWLLPATGLRWHVEEVAHIAGVAAPAISSYLLHLRLTFANVDG